MPRSFLVKRQKTDEWKEGKWQDFIISSLHVISRDIRGRLFLRFAIRLSDSKNVTYSTLSLCAFESSQAFRSRSFDFMEAAVE